MDGYTLHVVPADILAAASGIREKADTVKAAFSEIESYMNRTESYWQGSAAELNRTLFRDLTPELEDIVKEFKSSAEKLNAMAGNYQTTQQGVEKVIQTLPGDVIS